MSCSNISSCLSNTSLYISFYTPNATQSKSFQSKPSHLTFLPLPKPIPSSQFPSLPPYKLTVAVTETGTDTVTFTLDTTGNDILNVGRPVIDDGMISGALVTNGGFGPSSHG